MPTVTKDKDRTEEEEARERGWLDGEIIEAAADIELEPEPPAVPTGCRRKSL